MDVSTVRRFNRVWTQRVGALEESFLGTGLALGGARLLFEIGPDGATVLDLRHRLGLDSGYLSRLLGGLGDRGLVRLHPDPADGRRRVARLTERGQLARQRLEARSEEVARRLLEPLTSSQRVRLDEALATAERLVLSATVEIREVPADSPAALDAVRRYVAELDERFVGGFDPGPDALLGDESLRAPHGAFVLALVDGRPVGCGGVRRLEPDVAEVKRMWVDPQLRGGGLGGRLLRELEARAVALGHRVVRLDTNVTLSEAVAMYERAGYRAIARYNDNPDAGRWFEKRLVLE